MKKNASGRTNSFSKIERKIGDFKNQIAERQKGLKISNNFKATVKMLLLGSEK